LIQPRSPGRYGSDRCFATIPSSPSALATGMRISEVLALTWGDVDSTGGVIRVRFQLSTARKNVPARRVRLKTDGSERDIDYLPPELLQALRLRRLASTHSDEANFVFCTASGKPLTRRNADRAIRKAGYRAGLSPEGVKPVSAHDLRHSAISRWIEVDGLPIITVSRLAGHSNVTTTLKEYGHPLPISDELRADLQARLAGSGVGLIGAQV